MSYLSVPFQRVLSRMTAAEMKTVLQAQELLTGSGDDPPSTLSGEGAISYYDYNNGAGSYYATSPAYRYSGGRYPSNQRGRDIRTALQTAFDADKDDFLSVFSAQRRDELTRIGHPDETWASGVSSDVLIWNQSNYAGVTAPSSLSIHLPLEMYYDEGVANYTGATAATALAAKTAGQRTIKMGSYSHPFAGFWSYPVNSASTNNKWRECLFNADFNTYYKRGPLMSGWRAALSLSNSTWRTFWSDLRASGGANIIDNLIIDCGEIHMPLFWKKSAGSSSPSPAVRAGVSVSIDTGTDVLTATAHLLELAQPFKFSTSTALPTASNTTINTSTVYYVRTINANTFTLHLTAADAVADTNKVNFSTAGTSVTFNAYRETLENWFLDSDWATARDTILLPVLSQATWDGFAGWSIQEDERAFLFDAAYQAYFAEQFAAVLQYALDEFPDLKIADYSIGLRCPATRSAMSAPSLSHCPYGAGDQIGNLSSHSAYMTYDQRVFKWSGPGVVNQVIANPSDERTWATLVQNIATLRSTVAADIDSFETWIAPTQGGIDIPEDSDWASEYILHSILPESSHIGFYNSEVISGAGDPTVAQQTLCLNLIAERDRVVEYAPAILDPQDDLDADYDEAYVTTRVWAGGRWVWRVTPNPSVSTTLIYATTDGVRFSFDGTVLNIPGGYLHQPGDTYAPNGYWVVQPVEPASVQVVGNVQVTFTQPSGSHSTYRGTLTAEGTYRGSGTSEATYLGKSTSEGTFVRN